MKNKKLELLSPAGNLEKAKYAITYGADALYLGVKGLSLRVKENEFTFSNIKNAIKYIHNNNKKAYITTNIYPRGFEEKKILSMLEELYNAESDAFIISDPGIVMLVKDNFDIPIHLSVQANTTNKFAAKFWYKQGVKRVILPRELSIQEVKEIHSYVPNLELEFFVHGSICVSYSGRCLLSAYLSKRNPNLGVCSQPCRWAYKIYLQETKSGNILEVEEDKNGTYILNSKDLCLIKHLKELIDSGVISFKIEGRNKTEYYVALVTKAYRQALDKLINGEIPDYNRLINELKKAPNRGFITSYIDMPITTIHKDLQNIETTLSQQTHHYIGKIKKVYGNKVIIEVKNRLFVGDEVEIITPERIYKAIIKKIIHKKSDVSVVHGGQEAIVEFNYLPKDENIKWGLMAKRIN